MTELNIYQRAKSFIKDHGMSKTAFGMSIANNSKLLDRLEKGIVNYKTIKRVEHYMRTYPRKKGTR